MKRFSMQKGFTLIEMLVVVLIVALMLGGGFLVFSMGESSWFTAGASIELQESLRRTLDQVTMELRESKYTKMTISDGTGIGGSDEIRFSLPVICHTGDNLLDTNGDIAHWGATLRWGCRDATCMDADDDCTTVDYQYVKYALGAGNQLIRYILRPDLSVARQDIFAINVSDFQVAPADITKPTVLITVQATAQVTTVLKRPMSTTVSTNVFVRN